MRREGREPLPDHAGESYIYILTDTHVHTRTETHIRVCVCVIMIVQLVVCGPQRRVWNTEGAQKLGGLFSELNSDAAPTCLSPRPCLALCFHTLCCFCTTSLILLWSPAAASSVYLTGLGAAPLQGSRQIPLCPELSQVLCRQREQALLKRCGM